jgi:Spy/CpxP family protein refolding chaperone
MHSTTRPTPILRFLLPAALLLAACDRADAPETTEPLDDRAAEAAPAVDEDAPPRERAHHGGNGNKLERLCETLACTDEQRVRIEGLAARLWAERPEPAGDPDAANRALAQAFGGEAFSAADLRAFRKAAGPDVDEVDAMLVEAVVELHGILDAEQRATLADKIEHKGLPFVGGHGGKHHGKGKRGDDDRGARMAEKLCEAVACTEDQRGQITSLVQARPEPGQVPQAERQALAAAFRGPTLSDDPVNAYLDAAAKVRAEDQAAFEAHVVRLHGLLTPQQRAELARRIAEDGPRALGMPGKRHHGKQGRREPHGAAAQQFG